MIRISILLFTLVTTGIWLIFLIGCSNNDRTMSSIEPTTATTSVPTVTSELIAVPGSGMKVLSGDEALRHHAQYYADDHNVSVDEAMHRFEMQDDVGPLGAKLKRAEKHTFAGLWLQHEPSYGVIIAFTENGEETIRKYVEEGSSLDNLIELRTFPVSYEELSMAQQEASSLCKELGIPASSGVNVFENQAEIYVSYLSEFEEILQASNRELPDYVAVIAYEESPIDTIPINVNSDDSICFPQMTLHSTDYDAIWGSGMLVQDGCCLRLSKGNDDPGALIIWMQDYFVSNNNGIIEIVNADGEVVGRVGESVSWGGGDRVFETISYPLKEPLPDQCEGPYVYQGSDMRLVINDNPELVTIDMLEIDDKEVGFIRSKQNLYDQTEATHSIDGKLSACNDRWCKYCPRITIEDWPTSYLVIWPPSYGAQVADGHLEIVDELGAIVARDGDEIHIDGCVLKGIGSDITSQLHLDLPTACNQPCLIVKN